MLKSAIFSSFLTGDAGFDSKFELRHPADGACGIPDAQDSTIVLIGGENHKYVTRWVDGKIISVIVIVIVIITVVDIIIIIIIIIII